MGYPNMSRNYQCTVICATCGKQFTSRVINAKYCSDECNPHSTLNRFKTHRDKPQQYKPKPCERCHKDFVPTGSSVKYCDECKVELKKLHDLRKPIIKCPCCGGYYIRKGNHQKWCEFCRFKQMSTYNYRTIAFENFPHVCNRCGKPVTLTTSHVHHKDRNPKNNELSNLEILCVKCHRREHVVRDPKTGKIVTNK